MGDVPFSSSPCSFVVKSHLSPSPDSSCSLVLFWVGLDKVNDDLAYYLEPMLASQQADFICL